MIPASISDYLDRNGVRYSVLSHRPAYTAQEEAAASHVPGSEWAKSVVCLADGQPILAVLPAASVVDLARLQHALHARSVRVAREAEFANLYSDCELGAMPPLGPLYGQRVVVDKGLTLDPEIAFPAGSHRDAIRMPYREFERVTHPTVADFAAGPSMVSSSRAGASKWTDPVCGSSIEEYRAAGRSEFGGETFYFCSQRCKMEFDDHPHEYSRNRS